MLLLNVYLLGLGRLTYYALSMFDFIKSKGLPASGDSLLTNEWLLFPLAIDEQTGAEIPGPREAMHRGLTFTLKPRPQAGGTYCEMSGSIHRFYNRGAHNANGFTVANLLEATDVLADHIGIDPGRTPINSLEFNVTIVMPFAISQLLDSLISYKNRSFSRVEDNGVVTYACDTQRYTLKIYDKGADCRARFPGVDVPDNLLRIEIRASKMEYFRERHIGIYTLTDLLDKTHYPALGNLLVEAFEEVLIDEPGMDTSRLTDEDRLFYEQGKGVRYWDKRRTELEQIGKAVASGEVEKRVLRNARQELFKDELRYRHLLQAHRPAGNWLDQIKALIRLRWSQTTQVSPKLDTILADRLTRWPNRLPESTVKKQAVKPPRKQTPTKPADSILTGGIETSDSILTDPADLPDSILTGFSSDSDSNLTGGEGSQKTGPKEYSNRLDKGLEYYPSPSPESHESTAEEEPLRSGSSAVPVEGEDLGFFDSNQRASASSGPLESSEDNAGPVGAKRPTKAKPAKPTSAPKRLSAAKYVRQVVVDPVRPVLKPMTDWQLIVPFEPVPPVYPHPSTLGQYARFDEQGRSRRWCPMTGIEITQQEPQHLIIRHWLLTNYLDRNEAALQILLDSLFHHYQIGDAAEPGFNARPEHLFSIRLFRLLTTLNQRWASLHGETPDPIDGI